MNGGAHGWRFDNSHQGKRKTLSLGTYPVTGLQDAREEAEKFRKLVAAGVDPSETRKDEKAKQIAANESAARREAGEPEPDSFEGVAREWLREKHQPEVSEGHAARTLTRFDQDVFPWVGSLPLDQVTAPKLLEALRRIESRGAYETTHRLKDSCGQVFRYGIATGRCDRDPAADLRDALRAVNAKNMASITEPKRAGELLRAIDSYGGSPVTKAALRPAPMLFQRPGNLRAMEWAERDLDTARWTIPSAKIKRSIGDKLNGHPLAQYVLMHVEVTGSLRHRHASLLDQPHRLKLELPAELPSRSHISPPVSLHTLARCP